MHGLKSVQIIQWVKPLPWSVCSCFLRTPIESNSYEMKTPFVETASTNEDLLSETQCPTSVLVQ